MNSVWRAIPTRRLQSRLAAPEPLPDRIDENQQGKFKRQRVAQAGSSFDRRVESRDVRGPDNTAVDESPYCNPHTQLDDEFGSEKHGNCDEKSHVSFNIVQER